MKAATALFSVYDKDGVVDFARGLHELGVKLISSGGTAKVLSDAGLPVVRVSDVTESPEMLDGRVKTLHPKIHAGILARRDSGEHMRQLKEQVIEPIDLVVVNLYPFEQTILKEDVTLDDALEMIDVGGPTLVRAAAKNHKHVTVVTDPSDYGLVLEEMRKSGGVSGETRNALAVKAFSHTARYDSTISRYLSQEYEPGSFPQHFSINLEKAYDLRYGENPHQMAAYYYDNAGEGIVSKTRLVAGGKHLSFNNLIDVNSALELVKEFDRPAAVIVKHLNPSGVGVADNISKAYELAHSADPTSAFGCIVALNRQPDAKTAEDITSTFVELVAAPAYSEEVLETLKRKKNMRVLEVGQIRKANKNALDVRRVVGGLLLQTTDLKDLVKSDLKAVGKRKPTDDEVEAMLFAWKVCKHTKSNSIILSNSDRTVGVGAGQMSRVDAVKIAAMKAGDLAKGSVMASDAFFPFRDGIDEAAKAGVTAVIQPGGSIRDEEVIKAADEHGMAMVFTGVRCFLH
ncbi:MAG: bifunctional phosphoribosylaminoimidazolecarboxamide formyltransferase/IMP cyclohydrolase [Candidatus Altiarchaeales archaeon]|nr:bifunctional phosphoribosylaminoimidazolecarboxamide formyltransferase/IMP cyclohydrolase [Candidatus Altiarchaeales archaeon]MBD3416733.1 bifunctional phosphoribosylaminoimidazolecarboxamide formyltransferase/IMP cyclohydrolase [Candidatus Altiarchaeales archaeon]